jgi:hypothetical protein
MKMIDNDILYITFPSEIQLPSASSLSCTAEGVVKTVQCSLIAGSPNRLKAKVTFTSGSNPSTSQFYIKVNNVKNAPSTAKSSVFTEIKATDSSDNDIMIFTDLGPTITNGTTGGAAGNSSDPLNSGNYGRGSDRGGSGQQGIVYIQYPLQPL